MATLLLLPCFTLGLALSFRSLSRPRGLRCLLHPAVRWAWRTRAGAGRALLLIVAAGMIGAGATILLVGMTHVFVPQDLEYMATTVEHLNGLNPRLIPLIAHDRAGFGGGVLNAGFLIFAAAWCSPPARHLRQALFLTGAIGFVTAIAVHPLVGYNNPVHLAPACLGAIGFFTALGMGKGSGFRV